jgi:hypothetical protein
MSFIQKIIEMAQNSPTQLPARINIPVDHITPNDKLGIPFECEKHYFQIKVNELFLKDRRHWYRDITPVVFVVSQYNYGGSIETVPFVVGPQIMDKFGYALPDDMIFLDTRVAGLHPFRGGQITLSVILYEYTVGNLAENFLRTLEKAANVFNFASAFSTYIKMADVIFEGIDSLLGLEKMNPLIGLRVQMDKDADDLRSGYFALINTPEGTIDQNQLWVKNKSLYFGNSLAEAKPFRIADYTLYSVLIDEERSDLNALPFYNIWKHIKEEALRPGEDACKSIMSNMVSLNQAIITSPDITEKHALELIDKYGSDIKLIRQAAEGAVKMGEGSIHFDSKMDRLRAKSLKIIEDLK